MECFHFNITIFKF